MPFDCSIVTSLDRQLEIAAGYCDLGMWVEANDALEEIEPELRAETPVVLVRLRIYTGLNEPGKAAAMREVLARRGITC